MIKVDENYRHTLVKVVMSHFVIERLFDFSNDFEKQLQKKFELNLNFPVKNIRNDN